MPSAITIVLLVVSVVWIALIVDCLRRDEFHGPFRRPGADRAFWLIALLLFDLPLAIVYLVVVRLRVGWNASWRVALIAATLVLALALRLLPLGEVAPGRYVAERGQNGAMDTSAFEAAEPDAISFALQGNLRSSGSSSDFATSAGVGVRARSIRVQALRDDPVLRRVALRLGRAFADLPSVDRVECALDTKPVIDAGPGPCLTVLLDLEVDSHVDLLVAGRFAGTLHVAMSEMPWRGDTEAAPGDARVGLARIDVGGSLELEVWRFGYAAGTARSEARREAMAGWVVDVAASKLEEFVDRVGALPPAPPAWTGIFETPAEVREVAERLDGELVHASSGTFTDARLVWAFDFDDVETAFERARQDLEERGFEVSRRQAPGAVPILDAERQDAWSRTRLCICAAELPRHRRSGGWIGAEPTSSEPRNFVLTVSEDFSAARLRALAADVVDDLEPAELALVLADHVPADRRDALLGRIDRLRDPGALLAAARVAGAAGRGDLQAELLRRGFEVQRAFGSAGSLFDSAARKADVELPDAGARLDADLLAHAGFSRAAVGEVLSLPLDDIAVGRDVVFGGEPPLVLRLRGGDTLVRFEFGSPRSGRLHGAYTIEELLGEAMHHPIGLMDGRLGLRVRETDGARLLEVLVTQ